jgi:hypothetical protein
MNPPFSFGDDQPEQPSLNRRDALKAVGGLAVAFTAESETLLAAQSTPPFGDAFPNLDSLGSGEWWRATPPRQNPPPPMDVPRDQVIAFAMYTQDQGTLNLTAHLYPLKPDEPREASLEFFRDNRWEPAATVPLSMPGWTAIFRIPGWDATRQVAYRVRHGAVASFEGTIRRDPIDKDVIVVANMSCNSSRTTGRRDEMVENLKRQDPDLLFFAGDQTYRHTEHTAGWIEFGLQFRDVIRDRPTICIPDDHDVGHGNLWGENGKQSTLAGHADGGYFYPVEYVNMVQRQQTSNLPEPFDNKPVNRGISVYYTRLRVGGIDFAILEDRKFKSGPAGKIPQMGPRPDHINDPAYDPKSIDLPGLELLGERQERFLRTWGEDWTGAQIKAVLSQTAFCGAVHMHGTKKDRLLADLDCNGWPQTPRKRALTELRRVRAIHLCGDQHLAVTVKHGIDRFGDGPYAFTSPALVNTIYGRWWHPEDEKPGPNPRPNSPLPWTGDFHDGLGNKISVLAYANPADVKDERTRGDGYGIARFNKKERTVTLECWPRFADVSKGDAEQYPGWPITVSIADNDGRKPAGWLPRLQINGHPDAVVQVINQADQEILYTLRTSMNSFQPPVFAAGTYTLKVGRNRPDRIVISDLPSRVDAEEAGTRMIDLS